LTARNGFTRTLPAVHRPGARSIGCVAALLGVCLMVASGHAQEPDAGDRSAAASAGRDELPVESTGPKRVPEGKDPGLDALLQLPSGFVTNHPAAVAGAGESEWRRRFTRAEAERARVRTLFEEKAATPRDMEGAEAEFREAEAGRNAARARLAGARAEVARADGRVREAEVALAYTRVVAPQAGEVVRRLVEPGDLAWSGRSLVALHDARDLRLEAGVREGLVGRATVGVEVKAHIEALGVDVDGTVDEVVPSGDPLSRTFLVKVAIPYREGLLTGMFGRLRLPLGERRMSPFFSS